MNKVEQFYNKNQFLIRGDDGIIFQSYDSTIARIDNQGGLMLLRDWDYSKTTMKHLYLFLYDYYYLLNEELKYFFRCFAERKNKRKYIQELIDKNIIKYTNHMED